MAERKFFVDINLQQQQLKNAVIHTVADEAALAALPTPVTGQIAYQTGGTSPGLKVYTSGAVWADISPAVDAAVMEYKGARNVITGGTAAPGGLGAANTGDMYIATTSGVVAVSYTGAAGKTIEAGDFLVYNHATTSWDIVNTNVISASTTEEGTVRLADATETTNVSGTGVLTASNLATITSAKKVGSVDSVTTAALVANTELTTTFTDLSIIDSAQVFDVSTGEELFMNLRIVSNTVRLTSNVAFAGGVLLKVVGQHVALD